MDNFQMDYASDYEGSCGRSHHHGHHSHVRSHHHHRGRSPSSAGRSTPGSDASNEQAKTRMRWILSLGLLLPALAAIIGVVAWAVSAEVVMGARRDSAFKLSGPASRFHSNGLRSEDEFGIDRLDLKPGEAKSRIASPSSSSSSSPSSSSSISTAHRNGMSKESRISESKLDDVNQPSHIKSSFSSSASAKDSDNRNANVYFLAGLESLNSEAKPSFAGYRSTDSNNNKKSAGARVAEVIDRLVQQRKSEGSSPHIVVVAPLSDKSKKSGSSSATQTTTPKPSTTTTTQPPRNRYNDEPGAFSRDADTLLAAAHLLARHSIASKRSDDEKGIFSIETSSSAEKPSFESGNLVAAQPSETVETTGKETVNTNNYTPSHANQQIAKHAHTGSVERTFNGQGYHGGHMMASASQHHPAYMVSRMGHGPMPSHYRSGIQGHHGAMGQIHHQQQHQHQQHQHQQGHQQMMAAASQQNPTYVSSFGQQHFQGFNGDHQGVQHHHAHLQGHQQNQGNQVLGPQQSGNQGYQMAHPNQPNGQQVGRDYQLAENFQRPTFINNRESYVAQESAPLLDFHASQVPPEEESGGYQESSPAKGLTFHFGGGPVGGGGQVMTSPLGIFKTLLLPLLPKPRVNLNGKVVFGVVLEKGVGYGKQKKHHPPPPPPPPHGFHHFGRRR